VESVSQKASQKKQPAPFEIISRLKLGKGGEARADSTQIRTAMREVIAAKHSR